MTSGGLNEDTERWIELRYFRYEIKVQFFAKDKDKEVEKEVEMVPADRARLSSCFLRTYMIVQPQSGQLSLRNQKNFLHPENKCKCIHLHLRNS